MFFFYIVSTGGFAPQNEAKNFSQIRNFEKNLAKCKNKRQFVCIVAIKRKKNRQDL